MEPVPGSQLVEAPGTGYDELITLGNLSTDVFETRTATGRRKQMPLACSDLNQSVGKAFF